MNGQYRVTIVPECQYPEIQPYLRIDSNVPIAILRVDAGVAGPCWQHDHIPSFNSNEVVVLIAIFGFIMGGSADAQG